MIQFIEKLTSQEYIKKIQDRLKSYGKRFLKNEEDLNQQAVSKNWIIFLVDCGSIF